VDEDGNLTPIPPDPNKKKEEINLIRDKIRGQNRKILQPLDRLLSWASK